MILPASGSRPSWRWPSACRWGCAQAAPEAQIVLEETEEQPSRVRRGAVGAGAIVLAALAVYEAVNGKLTLRFCRRWARC